MLLVVKNVEFCSSFFAIARQAESLKIIWKRSSKPKILKTGYDHVHAHVHVDDHVLVIVVIVDVNVIVVVAITFPVLLEFVHVTTYSRRFKSPLSLEESIEIAEQYWNASNWRRLLPQPGTGAKAFDLLRLYGLGRKRLLDTCFAATLFR